MPPPTSDASGFVEIHRGEGTPEISILMPVCDRARHVGAAVRSVLAQRGVIAEVVISDDASTDASFEVALRTVRQWLARHGAQHRILMRRGQQRLRRDHLALLVDRAECDLVCQAHDDDLSHPDRARRMVAIFRAHPRITMATCASIRIDAQGKRLPPPSVDRQTTPLVIYPVETVLAGDPDLIGFAIAWRRSAVARFERLDSRLAAMGHDRILAFRAALAGPVVRHAASLVARREHADAWHRTMFFEPRHDGSSFGWSLSRVSALSVKAADLQRARELGLVTAQEHDRLSALLRRQQGEHLERMLQAMRELTRAGREIAWVDRETVARLTRGDRP